MITLLQTFKNATLSIKLRIVRETVMFTSGYVSNRKKLQHKQHMIMKSE